MQPVITVVLVHREAAEPEQHKDITQDEQGYSPFPLPTP